MLAAIYQRRKIIAAAVLLTGALGGLAYWAEDRKFVREEREAVMRQLNSVEAQVYVASAQLDATSALIEEAGSDHSSIFRFLDKLRASDGAHAPWFEAAFVTPGNLRVFEDDMRSLPGMQGFAVQAKVEGESELLPIVLQKGTWPQSRLGANVLGYPWFASALKRAAADGTPPTAPLVLFPSNDSGFPSETLFISRIVSNSSHSTDGRVLVARGLQLANLLSTAGLTDEQSLRLSARKVAGPILGSIGADAGSRPALSVKRTVSLGGTELDLAITQANLTRAPRLWILVLLAGLASTAAYVASLAGASVSKRAKTLSYELGSTTSQLQATTMREHAFFNNSATANCETDFATHRLMRVNDAMCALLGYTREELVGKTFQHITHPDDLASSTQEVDAAADVIQFQKRYLTKEGKVVVAIVTARLLRDAMGQPVSFSTVIVDITDRAEHERMRDALLKELAHRVRNTMQLTASLARQTARTSRSVAEYEEKLQQRLAALKVAQDSLFEGDWKGASLRRIIQSTVQPFITPGFSTDIDDVELPAQHAQMLALAVLELATNSTRFGALRHDGTVHLLCKVQHAEGSGRLLELAWSEVSPKPVMRVRRSGFGSMVLEKVLPDQFHGKGQLTWGGRGMTYSATLKLPD